MDVFLLLKLIVVKYTYQKLYHQPFLSTQLSSVKYIHIVLPVSSTSFILQN